MSSALLGGGGVKLGNPIRDADETRRPGAKIQARCFLFANVESFLGEESEPWIAVMPSSGSRSQYSMHWLLNFGAVNSARGSM